MVLYDDILPPLEDNTYRITVETDVTIDGVQQSLPPKQSFFSIQGPRFQMASTEIAAVFPPRNGHGSFSDSVPHIVLFRRTLPWERPLDPAHKIPAPTPTNPFAPAPFPLPPSAPPPWLALLVFEEGENFQIIQSVPLEQIVGPGVFADLGSPPNISCDALQTDLSTLSSLLPSVEEMTLLTHVRQVNVNDRELNIGSTDGFFSVVMSNRLPSPNSNCTACLVSLEARSDLVSNNTPAAKSQVVEEASPEPHMLLRFGNVNTITKVSPVIYFDRSVQLVLLNSWKFSCIGPGSFRDLMQALNVAMIGTVANPGHPPLTDTGHISMNLQDRAGVPEQVFYRGPLTPFQLTRDPLGPYHSADQCRRANPETAAEDISYAAAFETGRLIAAADKTLASALMQWRREAYTQSARADSVTRAVTVLNIGELDLHAPVAPFLAAGATALVVQGAGPISDPFGVEKVQSVVGFNPTAVQLAFNLDTPQQASAMLGGAAGATGAAIQPIVLTTRNATTIDEVAADATGLGRLTQVRTQSLTNTIVKLGMPVVGGISPTTGPIAGGATITISGNKFTGATGVNFGPAAGTGMSLVSDSQITAVSPAGQGSVDVTVVTPAGTSALTAADRFTYLSPPAVSAIAPGAGPLAGGTNVVITGSGFTGASAVNFGPLAAPTFTFVSDTQVTAVSPVGQGTESVTVTTPGGVSAASVSSQFVYAPVPVVTNLRNNTGPMTGGTAVMIFGSGFSVNFAGAFLVLPGTGVSFGPVPAAAFQVLSPQQITATSPTGQGAVDITVTTPGGVSATGPVDLFTYFAPPIVTGVNPKIGPASGGIAVTIAGNNFLNPSTVLFGPAAANLQSVTTTQIIAVAPPGQGTVDITVTTLAGVSALSANDRFTYAAPPTISAIAPASGPLSGGTAVTITGAGFTGVSAVKFGPTAASSFTFANDQSITAVSPANESGVVDISITASGGTSATGTPDQFTYLTAPVVIAVSPRFAPLIGLIQVVILGEGFTAASGVTFGFLPAVTFRVVSDREIVATAPPGFGAANVTVRAPSGTSATGPADLFTYVQGPTVTGVNPTFQFAGQQIAISGSNFDNVTVVHFGSVPATSFVVNSATQLTAVVPAGTGTVDVTVTAAGGTSAVNASDKFSYEILE
jgi:hypothetical protein